MFCRFPLVMILFFLLVLFSPVIASDLQVGFASFSIESQSLSPAGTALFSLKNPEDILVSEAAVGAVRVVRKGTIFVQQKGSLGTGVAFANAFNRKISLKLILRDLSGIESDRLETMELAPHEHRARFVNELFQGIPQDFTGSLSFEGITSDDRVAAVTLRQSVNKYGEPLFATLPVILDSTGNDTSMIFPHIGAGPQLSTQLILISRSESRVIGRIRLIGSDGKALNLSLDGKPVSEIPYEIPAYGVFFAELNSLPGSDVAVGYARVEVTEGILPGGTAIFRYFDSSGLVSEAGVGAMPFLKKSRIFVDTANTATGFAIANPGGKDSNIQFRLLDLNGYRVDSLDRTLTGGGHMALFASELFSLPKRFTGILEMESSDNFVPITLKLTTSARTDPILTTLPVANLTQPESLLMIVFPQLATGEIDIGEFSTRLIFIGPVEQGDSIGTMRFWKGTGDPFDLEFMSSQSQFGVEEGAAAQIFFTESPQEIVLEKGLSTSSEIGIEGGILSLEDSDENLLILEIPPYALDQSETIRMTALKSPPTNAGGVSIYPGLILEPNGLVLKQPARLQIILGEPVRNPDRIVLNWLGYKRKSMPTSNRLVAGQIVAGDLYHFTEFTVEEYNLSHMTMAAEAIHSMGDPRDKARLLQYYSEYFGFELDNSIIELLVRMGDLESWLIYNGMRDTYDLKGMDATILGLLEELMLDVLRHIPTDACGAYHSLLFRLTKLAEANPSLNLATALRTRLQNIESDCLKSDLSGIWQEVPTSQFEACVMRISYDEYLEFEESDVTEAYIINVNQNGTSLSMSFPEFPGSPSISGQLQATGQTQHPYIFTAERSGSQSLDCITFYQSGGYEFEFGGSICDPTDGCTPLSCQEVQRWTGKVSFDGNMIEGTERWTFAASARVNPVGQGPTFVSSLTCIGSGDFKVRRK